MFNPHEQKELCRRQTATQRRFSVARTLRCLSVCGCCAVFRGADGRAVSPLRGRCGSLSVARTPRCFSGRRRYAVFPLLGRGLPRPTSTSVWCKPPSKPVFESQSSRRFWKSMEKSQAKASPTSQLNIQPSVVTTTAMRSATAM